MEKIQANARFMSFSDDTVVHFFAREMREGEYREHAIYEIDGQIMYSCADGIDSFIADEECTSMAQAHTFLISHL